MTMSSGAHGILFGRDKHRNPGDSGFTIVETMVVLVVTGALFVAIAATLAGRQNAAQFTHAIQSVQSQLQQTIDQVSAGFYPTQDNFICADNAGSVQITAGSNSQGTNQDCVFLGKVIQFGVQNTDPEQYQVYTIAGLRTATAGATSPFQSASPTVIGVSGSYATYSTTQALEYGLTTLWIRSNKNSTCTAANCSIGAIGFLMEPGDLVSSSTTGYSSGAQQIDLVPLPGTGLAQSTSQAVPYIESTLSDTTLTADAPINPSNGVQLCFVSGGTNQSGLITIGGSGRQLLVTLSIKTNKTCT